MKSAILILNLLFAFLAPAAETAAKPAKTAPELLALWNRLYPKPPAAIDRDLVPSLVGTLEGCDSSGDIMDRLFRYRDLLKHGTDNAAIDKAGADLQEIARELAAKPGDACARLALATYATGSVGLLTGIWDSRGGHDPNPENHQHVKRLSLEMGWIYVTAAAYRTQVLKFGRESLDKTTGAKQVLGSYDCATTRIEVDPAQRPLNLAATIIHELTHYYFDKNSTFNATDAYRAAGRNEIFTPLLKFEKNVWRFPKLPFEPRFFRQIVILEESVAALHAAYFERAFFQKHPDLDLEKIGDLSLFSNAGPLARITEKNLFKYPMRPGAAYPFQDIVALAFLYDERKLQMNIRVLDHQGRATVYPPPPIDKNALREYRSELYDRVSTAYFGAPLSPEIRASLTPEKLAEKIPDFWQVAFSFPYPRVESLLTPFQLLGYSHLVGDVIRGDGYSEKPALSTLIVPAADGKPINLMPAAKLALLAFLNNWNKEVSPLCRGFAKASKEVLKDYRGSGATDHPGVDGIRPGVDGVRPGVDGVRPGVDGIRPGVDGVRPTSSALRMCVQIGDKL